MKRISLALSTFALFFCSVVAGYAQGPAGRNSAPIAWTEYRVASQNMSIQLPKLPTVRNRSNSCEEMEGASYYAYADSVAYEFEWHAKSSEPIPRDCDTKEKFSKKTFSRRVDALKKGALAYMESDGTVAGLPAKVLRLTAWKGATSVRWLVWDADRWFELGITHRTSKALDEIAFINGLKLKSSTGREIGDGSDVVVGDPDNVLANDPAGTSSGLLIITKPVARFTDPARQANFQGTVMLKVVFQKNGAIGDVTVLKEAPYGLTDETIKVAKQIGFLPAIVNGVPVTVTKSVEYSFTLY